MRLRLRRADAWALLGLTGLVLIAFRSILGPTEGLWYGDHAQIFRQRWWFILEAMGEGHLPARTLANGSGVPIESLLNATYTPLTLVLAAGPFNVMYDWFVLGHVIIACVGVYALFRSLGFSPASAFWPAIIPLSGPIVSFENLLVGLQGIAYAPWTYWALAITLREPRATHVGLLGLFGGWHLQGIMPEILFLDGLVGIGLIVHLAPRRRARLRAVTAVGAGVILAWAVSAIELMPVVQNIFETRRGQGFSYAEQTVWSLAPARLVGVVAPSFWSVPEVDLARFDWLYAGQTRPYLLSIYCGLLLSLAVGRPWRAISGCAAFALFVAMSLGALTPLHGWVARLPLMTSGRYPVKFLVLAMGGLAVALAYGPRRIMRSRRPPTALWLHAAAAVALWGWFNRDAYRLELPSLLSPLNRALSGVEPGFLADLTLVAQSERLAHAIAFPLLATLAMIVLKNHRRRTMVLTALLGLDVAWAAGYAIRGAPGDTAPSSGLPAALGDVQSRVYRLAPNGIDAPLSLTDGTEVWRQVTLDNAQRGLLDFRTHRVFHDYDPDGQSNPSSAVTLQLVHGSRYPAAEVLLGRVGVGAVSTWAPIQRAGRRTFPIAGQVPQYVFPIEPHRPYADFFARWTRVPPAALHGSDLDPAVREHLERLDTWDELLVLDPSAPAPETSSTAAAACRRDARAVADPPSPTGDVVLEVRSPCDGLLLVQETFVPGWTAIVDGQPAPVFEAEMGQTAVRVPAGAHRVQLTYVGRVHSWWGLSTVATVIAIALVLTGLRRAGREPTSTRPTMRA